MSRKVRKSLIGWLRYLLATLSLSILLYVVLALFFSTDEEQRLERENTLYQELYDTLRQKQRLIGDVLDVLEEKDEAIYGELFETTPPSLDALTAADLIAGSDSLSENFYLSAAASTSGSLMLMAGKVDECFAEIFQALEERRDSIPPLSHPLPDISYVQTGASVGLKHNAIYKVEMRHDGIDFIAPQGTPVYAAADGVVTQVVQSRRGMGNTVTIDHGNGYVTRYCLLGDLTAKKGKIRRGQQVGTVGITTLMPAPHLHYEVLHQGVVQDPVNYLFASVSPEEYAKMLFLSVSTVQSLD
ncbi:MAG: M23 family metallopeptidase [Bacteroidales bacterium]|nr:M23 family metallopeptidase [Bacteroidales bacterium]